MEKQKCILVIGANSDIAKEFAILADLNSYKLILVSRDIQLTESYSKSFKSQPTTFQFDAMNPLPLIENIMNKKLEFDIAIYFPGLLPDQTKIKDLIEATIKVNYTTGVILLDSIATYFKKKKSGIIVGVSSVAGERGKQSTYIYGSSKAGFTSYLAELRNLLYPSNIHVLTVKPGFVSSKMLTKKTAGFLTITPVVAAKKILKAIEKKKNVSYILPRWRLVMFIIKSIPESIFKKLKF